MEVHYSVYKYGGITAKFATLPGRDREAVDLRLVVTSMRLGFFFSSRNRLPNRMVFQLPGRQIQFDPSKSKMVRK
jgi:hypothetical protein